MTMGWLALDAHIYSADGSRSWTTLVLINIADIQFVQDGDPVLVFIRGHTPPLEIAQPMSSIRAALADHGWIR